MAQIWSCPDCVRRLAATALIRPLAWETPHAAGAALKRQKKEITVHPFEIFFLFMATLRYREFPGPGIKLELQQQAYATATPDLTYATVCSNSRSSTHWESPKIKPASLGTLYWVLNPQSHNANSGNTLKALHLLWNMSLTLSMCSLLYNRKP